MKTIYEDDVGKISGKQNKHGSITLFADHKDGLHEEISIPKDALQDTKLFISKYATPAGQIRILSKEFDLTSTDDTELATILQELSGTYIMCRHELSTATLDVWAAIFPQYN